MVSLFKRHFSAMLVLVSVFLITSSALSGEGSLRSLDGPSSKADTSVATETLVFDHVHFGVPDPAKAVAWYAKYMGGQPGTEDEPNDRLLFGKTRFIFFKTDNPLPSTNSAIDHIGFSVADLDEKMKEFQAAGIKIVQPVASNGSVKYAYIEDPWGAKLEVVHDPETLGFHHVHLRS